MIAALRKPTDHVALGCRQRWRALNLAIKAKLEAVESGIVTFDQEFLAHIVGPSGQTVKPLIALQYLAPRASAWRMTLDAIDFARSVNNFGPLWELIEKVAVLPYPEWQAATEDARTPPFSR